MNISLSTWLVISAFSILLVVWIIYITRGRKWTSPSIPKVWSKWLGWLLTLAVIGGLVFWFRGPIMDWLSTWESERRPMRTWSVPVAAQQMPTIEDLAVYAGAWSKKIDTLGYSFDFMPLTSHGEIVKYQVRINGARVYDREFDPSKPSSVDYGNNTAFFELSSKETPIVFHIVLTPLPKRS